jgi:hypothetical protein
MLDAVVIYISSRIRVPLALQYKEDSFNVQFLKTWEYRQYKCLFLWNSNVYLLKLQCQICEHMYFVCNAACSLLPINSEVSEQQVLNEVHWCFCLLVLQQKFIYLIIITPIPVAAQSKALVCGWALAGIMGSNPTGGMDVCVLWVFVLWGRGLCDGPIPRPEESYRLWCVSDCDQVKITSTPTVSR